jgi:predicted metal-dependent phosphoesterase TrpH
MGIESLHLHTQTSDGEFSHLTALEIAAKHKIKIIAFTDHDAVPNPTTVEALRANKEPSTGWLMGIEVSSGLPTELGSGASGGPHLVGLGINPFEQHITEYCQLAQHSRIERMERIVGNLRNLGFDITEQACLAASGGESVGRPHIVAALNLDSHPGNKAALERIRAEMQAEAEHNKQIEEDYVLMTSKGPQQLPYTLFLSDKAFTPGVYVDSLYWKDFDESVKLIREAGGLAFMAHYWTVMGKILPDQLDNMLTTNRLDGVETVFGLTELLNGHRDAAKIRSAQQLVREMVQRHDKLASGGADIHTENDYRDFGNTEWYSIATVGMAKKITQHLANDWYKLK